MAGRAKRPISMNKSPIGIKSVKKKRNANSWTTKQN